MNNTLYKIKKNIVKLLIAYKNNINTIILTLGLALCLTLCYNIHNINNDIDEILATQSIMLYNINK